MSHVIHMNGTITFKIKITSTRFLFCCRVRAHSFAFSCFFSLYLLLVNSPLSLSRCFFLSRSLFCLFSLSFLLLGFPPSSFLYVHFHPLISFFLSDTKGSRSENGRRRRQVLGGCPHTGCRGRRWFSGRPKWGGSEGAGEGGGCDSIAEQDEMPRWWRKHKQSKGRRSKKQPRPRKRLKNSIVSPSKKKWLRRRQKQKKKRPTKWRQKNWLSSQKRRFWSFSISIECLRARFFKLSAHTYA